MTTDHDLDVRLLDARGVRDADLPALPTAFLDDLHATAPVLAAVPSEDRPSRGGRGRTAALRIGVAVVTAAARGRPPSSSPARSPLPGAPPRPSSSSGWWPSSSLPSR